MWKCQKCGGLQRINAYCKYCGFKFPTVLTLKQMRDLRKNKELEKLKKVHGRFD